MIEIFIGCSEHNKEMSMVGREEEVAIKNLYSVHAQAKHLCFIRVICSLRLGTRFKEGSEDSENIK